MTGFLEMFGLPLLACLMMVGVLGYIGRHVLKREIIFIDIALAQMAAVGAIAGHVALGVHGDEVLGFACAFGFVLAAAAFYAVVRRRISQISLEAVIGVTYAIGAAAALFLVGIAPGGHIHVHEMLAGSILWTAWKDIAWCGAAFAAAGLGFVLCRRPLGRISDDYEGARREGMKVVLWDFVFYSLVGLVISVAVRIAGLVLVFGFLIMPAVASAVFTSRRGAGLVLTWAIGAAASIGGLLFADRLDFSVGPSVALCLGAVLAVSALVGRCRVLLHASSVR
jgi:zinc/manganese transport system permease protein